MDDKLVVTEEDGTEITINVLDIIEVEESGKEYIVYSKDVRSQNEDMEVYVSLLEESDDSFTLKVISDEEKEMIDSLLKEDYDVDDIDDDDEEEEKIDI